MQTIRITGVPEHYNLPFYLLAETQDLNLRGWDVQWTPCSSGTGAMMRDLRDDRADVAILLTEGIVAELEANIPAIIVSRYVKSPLCWGVHTGSEHPWQRKNGITRKTRFAISRPKSGSHLMAYLYAARFNATLHDDQFVVVHNMDGAAEALNAGEADLFLWEKFTTKPLVDAGVLQRIDEQLTPWEPFVIVARNSFARRHPEAVDILVHWLDHKTKALHKNADATKSEIARRFNLQLMDVAQWFNTLQWDVQRVTDNASFNHVRDILVDLQIIEPRYSTVHKPL